MSRKKILKKIQDVKLARDNNSKDATILIDRLLQHPRNHMPAQRNGKKGSNISKFVEEATRVNAIISRVTDFDSVPLEVSKILKNENIPPIIKIAPSLEPLSWASTLLDFSIGIAQGSDVVTVTYAFAGVAETGTLVVKSGPDCPTSLNFLPSKNIVVIEGSKILNSYEDVWDYLRQINVEKNSKSNFLPRTVNFITGPSRSADIEQSLMLGVHGPQSLNIIVVTNEL